MNSWQNSIDSSNRLILAASHDSLVTIVTTMPPREIMSFAQDHLYFASKGVLS